MSSTLTAARHDRIRELIASAGGRFAAVEFIKKDGTLRKMQVQPAAGKFRVKGEDASESAQQAAATRAARHPNLYNVWDVAKGDWRSIDLNSVKSVTVDGYRFEVINLR